MDHSTALQQGRHSEQVLWYGIDLPLGMGKGSIAGPFCTLIEPE